MDTDRFKRDIIPLQSAMQLLAERILGNADDAEDIVQDVFVALWKRRDELDHVVNITSYCMQMTRTRCIDDIRRRDKNAARIKELQRISNDEILTELEEQIDMDRTLQTLLGTLPEMQRKVIQMKYFDHCETAQIERELHLSNSNVHTLVSRAIQKMKEQLNLIKK